MFDYPPGLLFRETALSFYVSSEVRPRAELHHKTMIAILAFELVENVGDVEMVEFAMGFTLPSDVFEPLKVGFRRFSAIREAEFNGDMS